MMIDRPQRLYFSYSCFILTSKHFGGVVKSGYWSRLTESDFSHIVESYGIPRLVTAVIGYRCV
jgi:hypothetical protein